MIPELVADLQPAPFEQPWWDAARAHSLLIQRCERCGALQHFPRATCTRCLAAELSYVPSGGSGELVSFTTVRRAPLDALRPLVPYHIGLVELDEHVRLLAAIVGTEAERLRIGLRVVVDFVEVTDLITLPVFRPVK